MSTEAPIKLLLVEDHQMTRLGLRLTLEQLRDEANKPFVITGEAKTGIEALEAVEQEVPDLVLMDIGLPEMDGIEATQRLRKDHPDLRIMMLTSKDNERDIFAALGAGADAYCMKGVSPEMLANAIEAVREGTGWLDPAIARIVYTKLQQPAAPQPAINQQMAAAPSQQQATPAGPPADCPLTPREMEVLKLIVDGLSNPEIAEELVITKATAKAHVHSILQKLCVDDRTQAAVLAMRQGYVQFQPENA